MKLAIISHKPCWRCPDSPSGFASDGGFPFQIKALSELFDSTTLIVPCFSQNLLAGSIFLTGNNLKVCPLSFPRGNGVWRKIFLFPWLVTNGISISKNVIHSDAVHTPIPGDVGTMGMLLSLILNKPLFVRYCGNWDRQKTSAEHFWKWAMEKFAGEKNVMLATGGSPLPPSSKNSAINWIFSTSMTKDELSFHGQPRRYLNKEAPRLIVICRQQPEKGTGVVIESLPLISRRFPMATLDVVGDGSALEDLKKLAHSKGINNRVFFHGKVDHAKVLFLLKQADLFCFPTTSSEGFPKVVLEALACGVPIISTPVSVIPHLLKSGSGHLIREAIPEELAQAILHCLEDPDRYQTMSSRAIELASRYSLEQWRDKIGANLFEAWGPLRTNV